MEHLEEEDYDVTVYDTAEPALNAITEEPDKYDIALIDYNLPGMDGITLTRKIRLVRKNLPVILISGYVNNPQKKLQFSVDVDVIMTKPINLDQMTDVIQRILNPEMYEE
ncbi:MAG: Cell cycle response regulator CtrA [Candidatus Marinimicrobia bacterium]|nr:Cell cycle response regulator CtrA [Candidatus Neomarinimicrobiota bacterium]